MALWDAMRDSIDLLNGWTIVCSAFLCAALLYAVGQPIFTDDAWWHLALGAFYLEQGPWLEADPLLFTAAAPPPPASWLADALFYLVWQGLGFTGLRMLHVALAAGILILAWHAIRRVSKSRAAATLGTALFGILAAYRLVQLRPDLFTIAGAITLYLLVLAGEDPPSWRRIAGATASMALWSNLHPAFPIGLALLAAACGASVISALHASAPERSRPRARATRLAWTLALAGLASAANPMGLSAHLLALRAGSSPESLAYVVDEWRATELFSLPVANLPPSPLSWLLVWVLLVGSAAAAAITLRRALRSECAGPVDLVPLALAATALGAMVLASRFLWLGLFPILLIAGPLARDLGLHVRQRPMAMGLAAVALLATVGFQRLGAWPMITHALPRSAEGYRLPYRALKYHADVAWLMADAELHGNLVAPYSAAGFLGFWLAPGIQTAVNGSLNVAPETMNAALAVQSGLGTPEQPELEALLDELEVDLFLGAGLPTPGRANRPAEYTTALLEESPSWLQIFRTPDASLFLRRNARNDDNLARIATYFERSGVPFDPTVGFEPARVLREAPDWAIEKRLVPPELIDLISGGKREGATVSELFDAGTALLLLGEYAQASTLNDRLLEIRPASLAGHRRRLWLDLRTDPPDREQRLRQSAAILRHGMPESPLARILVQASGLELSDRPLPLPNLLRLPVLERRESQRVLARLAPPVFRRTRPTDTPSSSATSQSSRSASRKS